MARKQDPKNLGEPYPETGLRAVGWNRKKIRELEIEFEKLNYEQISNLLDIFGIVFLEDIKSMDKDSILWAIADDWTYEQIKEEMNALM